MVEFLLEEKGSDLNGSWPLKGSTAGAALVGGRGLAEGLVDM